MKNTLKRTFALLLTLCMVIALSAVPTFAKTKTIKPKSIGFTTDKAKAAKSAKTVKKGTTYILKSTKKGGYLKFTAPKTKTYKFTVSHYSTSKYYANGYWYVMKDSPYSNNSITMAKVATQGGKNSSLYICSKSNTSGKKVYRFLSSRYAKTKITKGTTVYLYIYYPNGKCKLTIK